MIPEGTRPYISALSAVASAGMEYFLPTSKTQKLILVVNLIATQALLSITGKPSLSRFTWSASMGIFTGHTTSPTFGNILGSLFNYIHNQYTQGPVNER